MNKINPGRALLLITLFLISKKSDAGIFNDTTQLIDRIFTDWEGNNPGGVLKIMRNGKTIYSKSFGLASLEQGTKNTQETVFEAGSVTKQFTATSVLLLVRDGKLQLDDDIHKYIPELPEYGYTLTIKHLLTHTSGLKDWRNITYLTSWPTGTKVYTQDYALYYICQQQSLNFPPGDQYSYSNSNFDLLSILVARISGESYPSFVENHLLKPAGMTHSRIRTDFKEVIPHKALGYTKSGKTYLLTLPFDQTAGATGLLTTPEDLSKWNAFIYAEKLGKKVATLRLTQQVLNNGKMISYTLGGINIVKINGFTEINHGGLVGGYRTWLAYYPEKGISVAYMSNTRSLATTFVSRKISDIFFGKEKDNTVYQFIRIPPKQLKTREGLYRNKETDGIIELELKDSSLKIRYGAALKALSANKFMADKNHIDFTGTDDMIVYQGDDTTIYKRVTEVHPSQNMLSLFSGNFYSPDCATAIKIVPKDGYLLVSRNSFDTVRLTPYYSDDIQITFRGLDHGLRVLYSFSKNDKEIKGISVSLPRAMNIPFVKTKK